MVGFDILAYRMDEEKRAHSFPGVFCNSRHPRQRRQLDEWIQKKVGLRKRPIIQFTMCRAKFSVLLANRMNTQGLWD